MAHADAEVGKRDQRQFPGQQLVDEVGDLRGVAGAVDAAGLDDDAGQAVLGDHPLRDPVRLQLRLLVVGGELVAGVFVGLVDDLAVGVAEDAAGRDVDDPRRLRGERGLEHAFGPGDVGVEHRLDAGSRGSRPRTSRRRGSAASQPSSPARIASPSPRSPATSSQPISVSFPAFSGLRTRQTTSSPRSRSCRTTSPPMKPVAAGNEDLHSHGSLSWDQWNRARTAPG